MRISDWSSDVCSSDLVAGSFVFGSEGAIIFIMFDNRSGMVPKFADANDQVNFDEHFRKDVEAVATGQCEKTVAILPLRATYTRGRRSEERRVGKACVSRCRPRCSPDNSKKKKKKKTK